MICVIGFIINILDIKLPSNVRPYIDPQAIKDRKLKIYNRNYYVSNNLRANQSYPYFHFLTL